MESIHGWDYEESSPIDRSTAMLMRLKACVPEMPLVLLHGINDGTEQWSALRHDPAEWRFADRCTNARHPALVHCKRMRSLVSYYAKGESMSGKMRCNESQNC